MNDDKEFRAHFCERVGKDVTEFHSAEAGGKHAKQEKSVLGGFTAGKTDVAVYWKNGTRTNVSIKKRAAGQAYLVTVRNFISAYQAQYHVVIPSAVVRALELFIGEATDSKRILDATDISVDTTGVRALEHKHNHRLVFDVIYNYDARMANGLLAWLKDEIVRVFEISFAAGAVADRAEWSDVLWYKNLVNAEGDGLDYMVSIKQVMLALQKNGKNNVVEKGPKNRGSTLQLPFGHLQYHQKQLEFYQQMKKIQALLNLLAA